MFERGGKEMKKFTTTLLLAIGLLVGFTVNAQAVNAATLNMSYSDYWYDRAKADGSEHHSWHFTLYDMDGEVALCEEYGLSVLKEKPCRNSRINFANYQKDNNKFADLVYDNVEKHKYFITNLGKCTQVDARILPNSVYTQYLDLLCKEIEIVNPKIIITLGNQVSSIILDKNISVSQCRKQYFQKNIAGKNYKVYPVYYPIGNGMMNIDKAIEDLKFILKTNVKTQ